MVFGDDNLAARNLLQIMRNGLVGCHATLEQNRPPRLMQKQLTDAIQNRARLRTARTRQQIAYRDAVLELVDGGGRKHGANGAELLVGVIVHTVGNLLHGHAQLRGNAVQVAACASGADARHHRQPHAHLLVEYHALAILTAAVYDSVHIWIVALCASHVSGNLTDLEIVVNKPLGLLHDLAARHHRAGNVILREVALLEEVIDGLLDGAHVAPAAGSTLPRAGNTPRLNGFRPLINGMQHLATIGQHHGLEGRGTNVYSKKIMT